MFRFFLQGMLMDCPIFCSSPIILEPPASYSSYSSNNFVSRVYSGQCVGLALTPQSPRCWWNSNQILSHCMIGEAIDICLLLGISFDFKHWRTWSTILMSTTLGFLTSQLFTTLWRRSHVTRWMAKCCKTLKSTDSRTQKITSRMHSGLSARTREVRVLNANLTSAY